MKANQHLKDKASKEVKTKLKENTNIRIRKL
jgi:hypothetical protein